MSTKTYTGTDFKSILSQIRQDQGQEALIIKSEKIPHPAGAEFGFSYEVTVAEPTPESVPSGPGKERKSTANTNPVQQNASLASLVQEIRDLAGTVQSLKKQLGYPAPPADFPIPGADYQDLVQTGVDPGVVRGLLNEMQQEATPKELQSRKSFAELLHRHLTRSFRTAGKPALRPGRPLKIAFVGPSGAGKTLSLIKMATHRDFFLGHRTAVVTFDTGKIAAIQQLEVFTRIAGITLKPIYQLQEIKPTLKELRDFEVILLDTPGRSPRYKQDFQKLRRMIKTVAPDELHLVLPLNMDYRNLKETAARFADFGYNRVLPTKLDEAATPGNLLNLARDLHAIFSVMGNGQNLPGDLLAAKPEQLALWLENPAEFNKERVRA